MARGGITSSSSAVSRKSINAKYNGPMKQKIQKIRDDHPQIELYLYSSEAEGSVMNLDSIKSLAKGKGLATNAMEDICRLADKEGRIVTLTPSDVWGSNVKRLVEFYKKFGFVLNKGKNKDFEISAAMYRLPKNTRL